MSSDTTKRWELIKQAEKNAAFHKMALGMNPNTTRDLLYGGLGGAALGAGANIFANPIDEDDEDDEGRSFWGDVAKGTAGGIAAGGLYNQTLGAPAAPAAPDAPEVEGEKSPAPEVAEPPAVAGEEGAEQVAPADPAAAGPPAAQSTSPAIVNDAGLIMEQVGVDQNGAPIYQLPRDQQGIPEQLHVPPGSFFDPVTGNLVVPDGQGGYRFAGPGDINGAGAGGPAVPPPVSEAAAEQARQVSLLGPNARPGPDGVMGTPDDGTGPSIGGTIHDQHPVDTAGQQQGRLGPNAQPGPDGIMGTPDDGTGPSIGGTIHDRHPVDEAGQQKGRLGPNAQPGPDGVMGTPDDGTGPSIGGTIHDRHPVDEAGQQKGRLGPNAQPGPDGVMGTKDDGPGPAAPVLKVDEKGQQKGRLGPNAQPGPDGVMGTEDDGPGPAAPVLKVDEKGQQKGRLGPNAQPGPDGVMGTKDDGPGPAAPALKVDEKGQQKKRLGPNARPGPDGVMGTKDDGTGPTISEQEILDKWEKGTKKESSLRMSPTLSPEEAVNFGHRMAKQAVFGLDVEGHLGPTPSPWQRAGGVAGAGLGVSAAGAGIGALINALRGKSIARGLGVGALAGGGAALGGGLGMAGAGLAGAGTAGAGLLAATGSTGGAVGGYQLGQSLFGPEEDEEEKSAGSYTKKKKKRSKKHRRVLVGPKGQARGVKKIDEEEEKHGQYVPVEGGRGQTLSRGMARKVNNPNKSVSGKRITKRVGRQFDKAHPEIRSMDKKVLGPDGIMGTSDAPPAAPSGGQVLGPDGIMGTPDDTHRGMEWEQNGQADRVKPGYAGSAMSAADRMQTIIQRGTANFFNAR